VTVRERYMSKLKLTFACGLYDRMLPLHTGEVRPEGIDLSFIVLDTPREIFDRMGGRMEFDVAEMSGAEFLMRSAAGNNPFVAIPVFPSRMFRHGLIAVNRRCGIKGPKDLAGKRIGVPLYSMSAAVWIRGHLQHDHGVDLSDVRWIQGAINKRGAHGNPNILPMFDPPPIEINDSSMTLSELLDARRIDAVIGTSLPDAIRTNLDIQRLFPNYRQVEKEYYTRTGIFPIMHVVVIKRSLYEAYPFVATSLYKAFEESKNIALSKMKSLHSLRYMLPWLPSEIDEINEVFGGDPWPYGLERNRATLEALLSYTVEQGIIGDRLNLEDLFVQIA
jgi:4,5-dihydroxyphthalate decarboxylase